MEEKDITANMARETIARQSNEDEVTAVFRLYILRFWSRERIENFCLNLLGVDVHEYRAWRQAVEQSVQPIGGEAAAIGVSSQFPHNVGRVGGGLQIKNRQNTTLKIFTIPL